MSNKSNYISIVDKIMLGQNKFLAIIEINSKYYLISITEKSINIIKELENFQKPPEENQDNASTFNNIFHKFKNIDNFRNNKNC